MHAKGYKICGVGYSDDSEDPAFFSELVIIERVAGGHVAHWQVAPIPWLWFFAPLIEAHGRDVIRWLLGKCHNLEKHGFTADVGANMSYSRGQNANSRTIARLF
jgi:hypothetical protein